MTSSRIRPPAPAASIAANSYLREYPDFDSLTEKQQKKYRENTFFGMEHVQDTHRLARKPCPKR